MIRSAQISDCDVLAELHVASWKSAYKGILPDSLLDNLDVDDRARRWVDIINRGTDQVLLHEIEKNLMGFASICPCRDSDATNEWGEISAIYYKTEVWGSGLATELMEFVCARLAESGYSRILIWVLRENFRARAFYEKFGFEPDGVERTIERGGAVFDEVRVVRYSNPGQCSF